MIFSDCWAARHAMGGYRIFKIRSGFERTASKKSPYRRIDFFPFFKAPLDFHNRCLLIIIVLLSMNVLAMALLINCFA